MGTVRLTMAQALLRFLDRQYVSFDGKEIKFVKGIMGIFGHGNVMGIGEALEFDSGGFPFVQAKNEQGMVHAAAAFAKQRNRLQIYACTSSIGPGALNMVTAAATATANRLPVLLLPGDHFASRQPDPVLQQLEMPHDYTVAATDAFRAVSKYWDRIVRPEQLMSAALQAMRVLTDPAETGAVTLALPQDVQAEAYDYPEAFFAKRVHTIERRLPGEEAIRRAAACIRGKRRPLLIAGGGVHYSDAAKALADFAAAFGIPVVETQAGKSALPWDHPQQTGAIGVTGSSSANMLARNADVIIGVGTRYSDFTTASKWLFRHPDAAFVNINVNALDAMKMDGVRVTGDARESLRLLRDELERHRYRSGYADDEIALLASEWVAESDRLYGIELSEGLAQTRALGVINKFVSPGDVVVGAAGSLPGDLHRLWRCAEPKTYHLEYGFSCMGYEVAGAFGAALAEPDRDVYAIVGDGSYTMLHSELLTSLQEGVKLTVLLFDNHGFQCIDQLQRSNGSSGFGNEFRYRDSTTGRLSGGYMPVDYAAHAASMGAKTYRASTAGELRKALEQAKRDTVSVLIDIKVVPGTNSGGYESWWHVGIPAISNGPDVSEANRRMDSRLRQARPY